jgi:hypothetical protein
MEIEIQKITPAIRFQIVETISPGTSLSLATKSNNDIFLWAGGAVLVISIGLVVIKLIQNKKKKSFANSMSHIRSFTQPVISITEQ